MPSNIAKADSMAIASLSAQAVADTTASSMPVVTVTVPSVSSIQLSNGSSTTWTHRCLGHIFS